LKISAQGLRYLNLLQQHTLEILYYGIRVIVPKPAAFVFHKFIVSERRKNQAKREKDIKTAKELGEYLLKNKKQKEIMINIFMSLPVKWKRKIIDIIQEHSEEIYNILR
jgi:hypothetical protein